MKVFVNQMVSVLDKKTYNTIEFFFELDSDDSTEGRSSNAGKGNVILGTNFCKFHFPIDFELPHPDILALCALKIISPYIGSTLRLEYPVSKEMAKTIIDAYPYIKNVETDSNLISRKAKASRGFLFKKENPAVSFSGGVDSVAVASLCEPNTPLIMLARTYHPEIGKFESWYNTRANIETMGGMPDDLNKIIVLSDFEYLSTNGKWCLYPDSYAFTIPSLLLSDFLDITHILTGDIWVAFTGDETVYTSELSTNKSKLFEAVGIPLEYPCNGVSELGTLMISESNNVLDIATSCQYGSFKKPCNNCIKCFRKALFQWALFGKIINDDVLIKLNSAPAVIKFSQDTSRNGMKFLPSYNYAFNKIGLEFTGAIGDIQKRASLYTEDGQFVTKIYSDTYHKNKARPKFVRNMFKKIKIIMPEMSSEDIDNFKSLDYKKYLPE